MFICVLLYTYFFFFLKFIQRYYYYCYYYYWHVSCVVPVVVFSIINKPFKNEFNLISTRFLYHIAVDVFVVVSQKLLLYKKSVWKGTKMLAYILCRAVHCSFASWNTFSSLCGALRVCIIFLYGADVFIWKIRMQSPTKNFIPTNLTWMRKNIPGQLRIKN